MELDQHRTVQSSQASRQFEIKVAESKNICQLTSLVLNAYFARLSWSRTGFCLLGQYVSLTEQQRFTEPAWKEKWQGMVSAMQR